MKTSPWIASNPLHHHHPPTPGFFLAVAYRGWQNPPGEAWGQLEPSMCSLTAVELPASCDENSFLNGLPRTILDSTLYYKTIWFKLFSFIIRSFDCHVTDKAKVSLIMRLLISKTRQQHGSSNLCLAIKDLVNRLTPRV